tara:strand:- start:1217 stop:1537 length:321 start_codon:yes stop_codon:yes gene_type:complete
MSIVTVDNYALDKIIDERIEMAMNIASEYSGCGLFDEDGKLVDTGMYQLTKGTLLEIMQYQQEQITKQREMIDVLVKSIADIDSLETLKKKLSALNINADKGGNNG